jgi:hypothetical protein
MTGLNKYHIMINIILSSNNLVQIELLLLASKRVENALKKFTNRIKFIVL